MRTCKTQITQVRRIRTRSDSPMATVQGRWTRSHTSSITNTISQTNYRNPSGMTFTMIPILKSVDHSTLISRTLNNFYNLNHHKSWWNPSLTNHSPSRKIHSNYLTNLLTWLSCCKNKKMILVVRIKIKILRIKLITWQ